MTFITIKIFIRQIRNDIIMKQKMNIKKKKNFMVMKIQKNMILGSIKKENKELVNKIKGKEYKIDDLNKKIITYKQNHQTINYKLSFWIWKIDEK